MNLEPTMNIRWNRKERQILLRAAAEAFVDRSFMGSPIACLREVLTKVLPPERQRTIHGPSQALWFIEELPAARVALRAERAREAEANAEAKTASGLAILNGSNGTTNGADHSGEPLKPLELEPNDEPLKQTNDVVPPADRLNAALLDLYEALRAEVREAAVKIVEETLADRLSSALPTLVASARAQKDPLKTSVVVVGLRGGQIDEIRKEFAATHDLRFIGSSENAHQLRVLVDTSDAAIGMAGFLSHSSTAIMKSRSKNYVQVDGGMTRLREALRTLKTGAPA